MCRIHYIALPLALLLAASGSGALAQTQTQTQTPAAAAAAAPAAEYPSSEAHYEALKRAAKGGTSMSWDKLPDWAGIWVRTGPRPTNPPLTDQGKAILAKTRADLANGIEWDILSGCFPTGYPRILEGPFEREFIVRPEEVWMHNVNGEETRRIYLDGRGHLPEDAAYPLWEGDSIGFWDGGSLVVHTTHTRAQAQNYFRSGPPTSEAFSSVEVWRKLDPEHLQVQMTFYDPVMLTAPWHGVYTYERVASGKSLTNRADQWSCEENSNVTRTAEGATVQLFPGDPGYRHPDSITGVPAQK